MSYMAISNLAAVCALVGLGGFAVLIGMATWPGKGYCAALAIASAVVAFALLGIADWAQGEHYRTARPVIPAGVEVRT